MFLYIYISLKHELFPNLCLNPPRRPPPPPPPELQKTAGPKTVAYNRKPQPNRLTPSPLHPLPLPKIWTAHATPIRVIPGHRRLLRRNGQSHPQNPRSHLRFPPEIRRREIHNLRLFRHHLVPVRTVLEASKKMCLTELFSAKRVESYEYIRIQELRSVLRNLFDSSGNPINLKEHLADLSLNVISRMVLGKKYTVEEAGKKEIVTPEEFKEMIDELFLLNDVLDIGDSIPWLAFLDLQGYIKRMKALSKKFDRFLEHVLDEHNERRRGIQDYVAKDMVDVLLQLADDPNLEVKLERHGVKGFTQVDGGCRRR